VERIRKTATVAIRDSRIATTSAVFIKPFRVRWARMAFSIVWHARDLCEGGSLAFTFCSAQRGSTGKPSRCSVYPPSGIRSGSGQRFAVAKGDDLTIAEGADIGRRAARVFANAPGGRVSPNDKRLGPVFLRWWP
jgi:hypothetical protein